MIILSLGSNMPSSFGDRFDNLNQAMLLLKNYQILIEKKSSFYETPSYPDKSKPKFINLIISIKTNLSPIDLMSALISIEEKLERKRIIKNDPRTCDIDIIDFNNQIFNFKYKKKLLIIPHKELKSRNFVLFPLKEILPNWKHPESKEFVSTLIQNLSEEDRKSILIVKKN